MMTRSFLSCISYLFFSSDSFLDWYTMSCFLSSLIWYKHASTAKSETSVFTTFLHVVFDICRCVLWSKDDWLKLWVSTDKYVKQAHSRNLGSTRLKCQDCWVGQLKNSRNSTGLICWVWWVSLYIDRINSFMKLIMFNF